MTQDRQSWVRAAVAAGIVAALVGMTKRGLEHAAFYGTPEQAPFFSPILLQMVGGLLCLGAGLALIGGLIALCVPAGRCEGKPIAAAAAAYLAVLAATLGLWPPVHPVDQVDLLLTAEILRNAEFAEVGYLALDLLLKHRATPDIWPDY